jgi:DNA-binding IscR family transcriptional regulator
LLQIVEALDGSIAPVSCVDQPEQYIRSSYCAAHDVWSEVKKAAEMVLDSLTLEDLAIKQEHKEDQAREAGAEALRAICARCGEDNYGIKS